MIHTRKAEGNALLGMRCRTLRCRLLTYAIPLLLFLVALIYFAFHWVADDAVLGLANRVAEDKVRFHKERAISLIQQEVKLAKLLAHSPELAAWALHEEDRERRKQGIALLETYRHAFRDGSYFFVIDHSGHYYFNDKAGNYTGRELRYTLSPKQHRDAWYYSTKRDGRLCQLNTNRDTALELTKVWVNCLVRHDGKVVGVVGTGVDLTDFINTVIRVDQPGVTNMYINENGAIQAAPDRDSIDFSSLTHAVTRKSIFSFLDRVEDRERLSGAILQTKSTPSYVAVMSVVIHGRPYLLGLSGIPEIRWFNVTLLDLRKLPLRRYLLPFGVLFALAMALLLVLLTLFLDRVVLSRIRRMERDIQQVKRGDYMIQDRVFSDDEIGRMTQSFYEMATAIEAHTSGLERRVRERTRDLERTAGALRLAKEEAERANLAKTRFLSTASHDLRQPLQAMRMYYEVLTRHPGDDKQDKMLSQIGKCLNVVQSMLDGLLDISRLDAGLLKPRKEVVSVPDLLERVQLAYISMIEEREIALVVRCPEGVFVRTDTAMLERVLGNLLSNAVCHAACRTILVACRRRGNRWQIEVRDDGCGIGAADRDAVFEEFYRLRGGRGLGLGLAIVKRLCALLGHEITLRSLEGKGSTFAILAEACRPPASGEDSPGRLMRSPPVFRHGLVIDDDALVREGLASGLADYADVIDVAASRDEAEALVAQRVPDFIICDFQLPGDYGVALICHLRQRAGCPVPAVLLTGDTTPEVLQAADSAGIPVVHKPVDIAELLRVLREITAGEGYSSPS